jgi:hypothetical protein
MTESINENEDEAFYSMSPIRENESSAFNSLNHSASMLVPYTNVV